MTHFAVLAFLIVCAAGTLVWLCLPHSARRTLAVGAFAALTVGAFAASVESTGQPRPLFTEYRNVADAQIIGLYGNESRQIVWVWAVVDGEPRAYSLPWPKNQKHMGELQDRWRRKGATGDEFALSLEGDIAKVRPPQPNPPKQ